MISATRLRDLLAYDPQSGVFTWRVDRGPARAGSSAGVVVPRSGQQRDKFYIRIGLDGRRYYAHVLAYVWMTGAAPLGELDHRNGDGLDNTWSNIRLASHAENGRHRNGRRAGNTSGYSGVSFHRGAKRWRARLMVNGREVQVGYFDDPVTAAKARDDAARRLHGEFAHLNFREEAA